MPTLTISKLTHERIRRRARGPFLSTATEDPCTGTVTLDIDRDVYDRLQELRQGDEDLEAVILRAFAENAS